MNREFQPYSNLWLTTHKWKLGKVSWMTDPWPEFKLWKMVPEIFKV